MTSKPSKVVIIGGGLAAPVLALSLKKHSIPSTIYELRPASSPDAGNLALAPNALRVLDHIGIYDAMQSQGYNYSLLSFLSSSSSLIGRVFNGSEKRYNFDACRLRRGVLRDELLRQARDAGVEVHFGKRCTGVESEGPDGVVLRFADGSTVTAPFVVGADGIHSRIRRFVDSSAGEPEYTGLTGIGGTIPTSKIANSDSIPFPAFFLGGNGNFAMMPVDPQGSKVGFFSSCELPDRSREEWETLKGDKEGLRALLVEKHTREKGWGESVIRVLRDTPAEEMNSWPYFAVPDLKRWSSPSGLIALIGDAAHAIPPTGGQGAAMAFEDAETLAYILSRCTSSQPTATLLPKWEAHRRARVVRVTEFTTRSGDMRKATPWYARVWKEWSMWAMLKIIGPEAGLRWIYEYNAEFVIGAVRGDEG